MGLDRRPNGAGANKVRIPQMNLILDCFRALHFSLRPPRPHAVQPKSVVEHADLPCNRQRAEAGSRFQKPVVFRTKSIPHRPVDNLLIDVSQPTDPTNPQRIQTQWNNGCQQ